MINKERNGRRCLIVCTGALHSEGGVAGVNRLVMRAVAEAGYHLDLFALCETESIIDEGYVQPDQIQYCVYSGNKYRFALAVWQALLTKRYEYVFVDHVNLAMILAPFKRIIGVKYHVWLCGIEVFPPCPTWEGRIGLRYATKRLAISQFTYDSVAQRFPKLPITICDLALDPVRHIASLPPEPPPKKPSSTPMILIAVNGKLEQVGPQMILHVGRMVTGERYKGQESLLRAFPEIKAHFPAAQVVFAGHGDDMPRLLAIAKSFPDAVQADIFMPGYVQDDGLGQLYRDCYLFAMPSTGEGFGLVFLEAMSRAKPCLGGRVAATPCVVRDGATGLLVDDPKSSNQVAATVCWLLNHPVEANTMGRAGYNLVRSCYLYEHFRERFWKAVTAA